MKPKMRKLLENCIDSGVELGWRRAHKHTDTPTEETIRTEIIHAIAIELFEWFEFEDEK
jgi:hypothetical protein